MCKRFTLSFIDALKLVTYSVAAILVAFAVSFAVWAHVETAQSATVNYVETNIE